MRALSFGQGPVLWTSESLEWATAERQIALARSQWRAANFAAESERSLAGAKASAWFAGGAVGALGLAGVAGAFGLAIVAPLLAGVGLAGGPLGAVAAAVLWMRAGKENRKALSAVKACDELEDLGFDLMMAEPGDPMEMESGAISALRSARADPEEVDRRLGLAGREEPAGDKGWLSRLRDFRLRSKDPDQPGAPAAKAPRG